MKKKLVSPFERLKQQAEANMRRSNPKPLDTAFTCSEIIAGFEQMRNATVATNAGDEPEWEMDEVIAERVQEFMDTHFDGKWDAALQEMQACLDSEQGIAFQGQPVDAMGVRHIYTNDFYWYRVTKWEAKAFGLVEPEVPGDEFLGELLCILPDKSQLWVVPC